MKAAIFDMDGTLLDSMSAWRSLNTAFVRAHGVTPTPEQEAEMFGMSGTMVVPYFKKTFGIECDFNKLLYEASAAMWPLYAKGMPLKPGAREYLTRLRARGVKCVVATATPSKMALTALNQSGLTSQLDFIFSTEMFTVQKNSIQFYEQLCALIGERMEDCIIFEDALYAMQGARSAGLGVIGITDATNLPDREAMRAVCDQVIDSFDELA